MQACVYAALLGADMRRTFYFIIFGNKKIKICAGARADAIIDMRVRACVRRILPNLCDVDTGKNSMPVFSHKSFVQNHQPIDKCN